jgi:tetratricopeptide (TPR) repeat protein
MSEVNTLYQESETLKDTGQLDEAIDKLQQALALDPNHVLSHLALAVLYGRVGKHDLAIEHGEKACELEPQEAFNFTAMSITYQRAWQGTQNQEFIVRAESARDRAHALQGAAPH